MNYYVLGNRRHEVKPWYLPFDWVFARKQTPTGSRVVLIRNSTTANVWGLPVVVSNHVVVGIYR